MMKCLGRQSTGTVYSSCKLAYQHEAMVTVIFPFIIRKQGQSESRDSSCGIKHTCARIYAQAFILAIFLLNQLNLDGLPATKAVSEILSM